MQDKQIKQLQCNITMKKTKAKEEFNAVRKINKRLEKSLNSTKKERSVSDLMFRQSISSLTYDGNNTQTYSTLRRNFT